MWWAGSAVPGLCLMLSLGEHPPFAPVEVRLSEPSKTVLGKVSVLVKLESLVVEQHSLEIFGVPGGFVGLLQSLLGFS